MMNKEQYEAELELVAKWAQFHLDRSRSGENVMSHVQRAFASACGRVAAHIGHQLKKENK